ncbi:hypothetical protein [Paenibacillus illinoisensis]|uniref:hypothetical protein n=1 Tax=Paenibacillus illinoisensis TaxID=59845 RepID=UPI00301DC950
MPKKRLTQREIGFIQGMVNAAALQEDWGASAFDVISGSDYTVEDIRKHCDKSDVEKLENVLQAIKS